MKDKIELLDALNRIITANGGAYHYDYSPKTYSSGLTSGASAMIASSDPLVVKAKEKILVLLETI